MNLASYLREQIEFSERTYGPGERTEGVIDHIKKELEEVKQDPSDLEEWCDVVILALDGAWRVGYSPEQICSGLIAKLEKNKSRKWPDWRTADKNKSIEHIRE